jgi:site-specific recombinase XerD
MVGGPFCHDREEQMSTKATSLSVNDLRLLVPDFERALRAAGKQPKTLRVYGDAARLLIDFFIANGMPTEADKITREHVETFILDQVERYAPATANQRYRSLAQLFKYLVEEGEISNSPMGKMKPPTVPEIRVPVLSTEELRKLLAVCDGRTFETRRDTAIIRLLIATGMRAGELIGMRLFDLDRDAQVAFVVGKARRPRACPYGAKAAQAIDRYQRARGRHSHAASEWLWLGNKGGLTDSGLRQMMERRGIQAGIPGLHPHQLRHTFAHEYLAEGGNEGDLMMLAGWKSRQMVGRYGASAAAQRARDAYHRLGMGDRV